MLPNALRHLQTSEPAISMGGRTVGVGAFKITNDPREEEGPMGLLVSDRDRWPNRGHHPRAGAPDERPAPVPAFAKRDQRPLWRPLPLANVGGVAGSTSG